MNKQTLLYRKRFIPNETILLKDDKILEITEDFVMTKWNCLNPRLDISYGYSAYFLKEGFTLSKVFDHEDNLVYWYCDIITSEYDASANALIVTDLLIDILVYANDSLRILDLNELADCLEQHSIDIRLACLSLRQATHLLSLLDQKTFSTYQHRLDSYITT